MRWARWRTGDLARSKGSTRWREVVIMRDSDSHYFAPGENNSFERYLKLGGLLIHR